MRLICLDYNAMIADTKSKYVCMLKYVGFRGFRFIRLRVNHCASLTGTIVILGSWEYARIEWSDTIARGGTKKC